jgi:hypothetical protein
MARRRWFLDDALLAERIAVASAHASLRQIATNATLPTKIRNECAHLALRLGRLGRDLAAEAATRPARPQDGV